MLSAEDETMLDDRSHMRAVRARISSRIDLTTGRILEENEAPSTQETPDGDMQSADRVANERVSSLVQEYTARKTVHGINYSVPRDWSEVSPGDFRAEQAKVAGNMQSDVAAYLADTDLIFAIGKSEDGVSNAVLTMRVSNLAPDEAFGQNDMKGLSEQERLELVSATEQSMGGMTAMDIPGLSSLELLEVNLVDAGNLLCIEATFTAMRDDGRDALYTNWNCPLDRLNLSLSFHVRSDRFEEYMPVVGGVLASLKDRP
jgi:hypothetical protein